MMKRIFAVLLLLVLLCGCSKPAAETPYTPALAEELLASGAFEGSEMAPLDMDVVSILFGIDPAAITEGVYYMAANTSVSADELLILVMADEQAAMDAKSACERRLQDQIAVCTDYCPAAVPRLESAILNRIGNTVLFVVGDESAISQVIH